jgi:hypothetical protein
MGGKKLPLVGCSINVESPRWKGYVWNNHSLQDFTYDVQQTKPLPKTVMATDFKICIKKCAVDRTCTPARIMTKSCSLSRNCPKNSQSHFEKKI